jgi:hypothetical protein
MRGFVRISDWVKIGKEIAAQLRQSYLSAVLSKGKKEPWRCPALSELPVNTTSDISVQ